MPGAPASLVASRRLGHSRLRGVAGITLGALPFHVFRQMQNGARLVRTPDPGGP
jgi:hypothetical protein